MAASLNIAKTVFVCIVLTMGAIYFTSDANRLVIAPIEKMFKRVNLMAANPMSNGESMDPPELPSRKCCSRRNQDEAEFETKIIEDTITKIGALLAIGFGEAGAAIIGSNMADGGDIDPMIEGNKVVGIFGFCDIRNFTDATEELLEGVMVFVNEIAEIVHRTVHKYQGAANKNIGDAFLLVWKFHESEFAIKEDKIEANKSSLRAKYVPDLALLAFIKIVAKINKEAAMLEYRNNTKLTQRLPGYTVKMGFGLHIGWGIEGAIGS